MSIKDQEIVIAGGSGGLGAEAARMLKAEGATLVLSYYQNKERAEKLAEELSGITIIQADVRELSDRSRLLASAPKLYGLVVMAGIPARNPSFWDDSLNVNYSGPFKLAQEAASIMRKNGMRGSIVLMGTVQAVPGSPRANPTYAGAKAALIHAGRILAKEFRGRNEVRINVISPGIINAEMGQASVNNHDYDPYLPGCIERWGRAIDVARAIRFFLEPDNYITGQNLLVDGGLGLGLGV